MNSTAFQERFEAIITNIEKVPVTGVDQGRKLRDDGADDGADEVAGGSRRTPAA